MIERRNDSNSIKESKERVERYPLIGVMGPLGSGKSTLSKLLQFNFDTPSCPIELSEERFTQNPHLLPWYKNPNNSELSLKVQSHFLQDNSARLCEVNSSLAEKGSVVDSPAEMYFLFALAQKKMGWMNENDFSTYSALFKELKGKGKIPSPDVFIVINTDPKVIRQRILSRGREFELPLIQRYPEYVDALCGLVKSFGSVASWGKEYELPLKNSNGQTMKYPKDRAETITQIASICHDGCSDYDKNKIVVSVDSEKMDFVSGYLGKHRAVDEVAIWINHYREKLENSDGNKIILPNFL